MKKLFGLALSKIEGFTFIEMVVVVGIISIALPTLYAIFFLILQQQVKIVRLSEVQKQGTFVVNTIESLIRNNALSIYSDATRTSRVCAVVIPAIPLSSPVTPQPDAISLYFKDKGGNPFDFNPTGSPEKIASESAGPSVDLTSSKVTVSNFTASCTVSGYSSPIVAINFDLCYNINGTCGSAGERVSLQFGTTVTLPRY